MPSPLPLLAILSIATAPTRSPDLLASFLASHQTELGVGDPAARAQLDLQCAQRDCWTSHLYWYTNLAEAEVAAQAQGKPILSLRLLGRLDEDLSCANSRFFRKMLYADPRVADYLREHYVLHWESVRPVPKVTIDFGDGRTLTRTLTGNSIHYVLDANGQVLDGLPGLYTPEAFLERLQAAQQLHHTLQGQNATVAAAALRAWHHSQADALTQEWLREALAIGLKGSPVEATPEEAWRRLAQYRGAPALPSQVAADLERHPSAWSAGRLAITKAVVENPLLRQLRTVGFSVEADSLRDELQLHRQIHLWLASGMEARVEPFNRLVYQSLFLSPLDDPWYGLAPEGSYPAMDDP